MVLWPYAIRLLRANESWPAGRRRRAPGTARPGARRAARHRGRIDLPRLLFTLALSAGLLLHAPIVARGWDAGEHLTPEQRAHHALLSALGHTDHHGAPPGAAPSGPRRLSATAPAAGLAPDLLPAVVPPTPFTVSADGLSCQPAQPGPAVTPAAAARQPARADDPGPDGCRPEPLELPPRLTAEARTRSN